MNAKKILPKMILLLGRLMPGLILVLLTRQANANPTGMTVQSGAASLGVNGSQLTVTAGNNAFLNWQHFNIAAGESTIFNQPSASSIVWNRINDANPSQIYGSLQANGVVVLLNSSGFYFGPNSFVSAAGLVVSTANAVPPQNAGGAWEFNGPPPLASIVNYGQIKVGQGGSCYLIADQVENHGSIAAPGGSIGLASGQTVMLSERPDGRGMSMQVTLPKGSVNNYGTLVADAGTVSLNAKVVNQNGFVQANSVRNENGVIELVAGDQLNLGADSKILAAGDISAGGSAGGSVTLKSQNSFSDAAGSEIVTTGGAQGGNGGNVEISAPNVQSLNSAVDARALASGTAGKLLLDPDYIVLDSSGTGSAGNGTILAGNNPGATLDLNVNTAFANLAVSQIILQAAYDITLSAGTTWNLGQTIGSGLGGVTTGNLTLQAAGNIVFGANSSIADAHHWSVNLEAGYDFVNAVVQQGVGNIYLNGGSGPALNGSIQLSQASLNLNAGNSIITGPSSQLIDDGGTIGLNATTIEQDGLVQANAVGNQPGSIQLAATGQLSFGDSSRNIANGGRISASGNMIIQNGLIQADFAGNQPGLVQIAATGELDFGSSSQVIANGGKISASGTTINQNGLIQADSVPNWAGDVGLVASDTLNLNDGSKTVADGGMVFASANNVNQNGIIQANSQQDQHGVIELVAANQLALGAKSQISAQGGDSLSGSAGGNVTLQGAGFSDDVGSQISTAGGAHGGNGGNIEIDAPNLTAPNSIINAGAQPGSQGGQVSILGLANIFLGGTDGALPDGNGTIDETQPQGTINVNVNSAFKNITAGKILLEASGNIELGTVWNLSATTPFTSGQLTLLAGGNIFFDSSCGITDPNSWSVTLEAGYSWANHAVQPGTGSIMVNPTDPSNLNFIETAAGSINLFAGQDILLGYGRVTTTGYGNIVAHAFGGNIDTGSYAQGYRWRDVNSLANDPYYVDPGAYPLGGISTSSGGSVSLTAGGNVTSYLPPGTIGSATTDEITAGSGAYGNLHGDVTVVAGGDVTGHYLVADGTGNIFAGVLMDPSGNPITGAGGKYLLGSTGSAGNSLASPNLSLSLIAGGWNVTAADNINLQEVNNPNGDFNKVNRKKNVYHQFDYAATDYVDLNAGNLVQLGASSSLLPRLDYVPMILPGILNITAGAGGVVLNGDSTSTDNQLTLFPSALGSLVVNTTHGGSLVAGSFRSEDPGSLEIGVSSLFDLIVSDSGLNSKGVNGYDPTVGNFGLTDDATIPVHLAYDTVTKQYDVVKEKPVTLNISGDMDYVYLASSEAAQITVGGDMKNSRFRGINLSPSDTTSIDVTGDILSDFYNDPATDAFGYAIGGGGHFKISAHNLDLGTTTGIQSWGVGLYNIAGYYPLAQLFNSGADIRVDVTGDLTMYNTSIASLNGGNIFVDASKGGNVEVGSSAVGVISLGARGIYTTDNSDVTVIANGNVDANGSRIAAYDGGNVTVESLNGDINAGAGGAGFVVLSSFKVDPTTHDVTADSPTIPGSGIVTTTFPDDPNAVVGNILVETPNGNVKANAGGIVQLPLNKAKGNADSVVEVLSGYELQDGNGKAVYADDLAAGTPVKVDNNPNGGNIDASGSGVIGENVTAKAAGILQGVIFGQNNVDLTAPQLQNLTVLGKTVEATGNGGSGVTLIGTESVTTSGNSSGETVLSQNANGSGSSFSQGNAANSTSTAASASQETTATAAAKTDTTGEDDPSKKKKSVTLARKVSRVTVLLPAKN